MTRRQEQPLGGARAPRPLARFSFAAPGPGSDAACSRRTRAPVNRLASARATGCSARGGRARATDPSPTAGVRAGAAARWGRGRESRGRASDGRASPPQRPRARTRVPTPPAPQPETLIPPGALGEGVPTSLPRSLPRAQRTDSQPPPLRRHGLLLTMFPEAKGR